MLLSAAETVAVRQRQAVTGPRGLDHLTSVSLYAKNSLPLFISLQNTFIVLDSF